MARTAVHITELTANAAVADPTGTTADQANGHSVSVASYPPEEIVLRIKQTAATASTATIAAGANPPAFEAGEGSLAKSMAQNEVWWVGPLTSARFIQTDGTIHVDLSAAFTGTIEAFHVPRNG